MGQDHCSSSFSPDRPINSKSEDLLGRANFAESLARAIKSWKGKDSLVIALYGPWGSGKSSVKNLVLDSLKSSPSTCPSILEFNPWQLASQSQITEAFFTEIGTQLGRVDTSANASQLAAKFHAYGRYLRTGRFALIGVKGIILTILGVIGVLNLVGAFFHWYLFLETMAAGVLLLMIVLGYFSNLFESISESFQGEAKSHALTIPEMKGELAGMLAMLQRPILVVLDDVDRLSSDELKLVFQLLKGNADFPNLIYLLLLSLDHAEESLKQLGGKDYIEKIVQVGFEIPKLERLQLDELLGDEIEKAMREHGFLDSFISEIDRWRSIYTLGARGFFRTIRDVRRFASVLAFQLSHFSGASAQEVNVVDLTALQVLALFEPKVYQAIFLMKHRLVETGDHSGYLLDQTLNKDAKQESLLDRLQASASAENRGYVREILVGLFPRVPFDKKDVRFSGARESSLIQSLRICHGGYFDRYFLLSISQRDLPESELHELISLSTNRTRFVLEILSVVQRGLYDILFERLEANADRFDMDQAEEVVTALYDVGDMIPQIKTALHGGIPEERIAQVVSAILARELDASRRQQIHITSLRRSSGVYVPLLTHTQLFHASSMSGWPDFDVCLRQSQEECVKKIELVAQAGTLNSNRNLGHMLRYWDGMGGPESRVRQWVLDLIKEPGGLVKFLRVTSHLVTSTEGRFLRTDVQFAKEFISLEQLDERINHCLGDHIDDKARGVLSAWREALSYLKSSSDQAGQHSDVDFALVEL